MPRKHHGSGARQNRMQGIQSGTTYVTQPSGVTITKDIIEADNFRTVKPSGVTITGSNVQNDYGYMGGFVSSGIKMTTGTTDLTGAASLNQQTFTGITKIKQIFLNAATKKSGATLYVCVWEPNIEPTASGVSTGDIGVYVVTPNGAGTAVTSGVSVDYLVIGA